MKNSKNNQNKSLMQQFAAKSIKKKVRLSDRAVIYNRCSSEKQDSLDWQEQECRRLSQQQKFDLVRCWGEKESATTDERKEFQEMVDFCLNDKNNIGHIIIYSYNRFSRTGDLTLINKLRKKGIKVHAVTQGVDTQTPSGKFSENMYLMFAEMENEQRRNMIIEGQKNKLRKGEWLIKCTIGYEKRFVNGKPQHPLEKRQCFINEKGKYIRQAFLWKYHENLSLSEIVRRLNNMGIKMTVYQLARIFRNPFYCGYVTSRLVAGELIRGKHEPLISEEIFLAVNGLLNSNSLCKQKFIQNEAMPLKYTVKCEHCGKSLTAYTKKEKYVYYKCQSNDCHVNVGNNKLHTIFAEELAKYTIAPSLLPAIKRQLEMTFQLVQKSESARQKPMKDELTRLKNELETMELNLATSKISMELFQKVSSGHMQKIREIEADLSTMTQDTSNYENRLNSVLEFACNLLKIWQMQDYAGKVCIQKLVFPEGLSYIQKNHSLRTNKVNPIFSEISSISTKIKAESACEQAVEDQDLRQLYLRFPSSNFILENLAKIEDFLKELGPHQPRVWESISCSHLNQSTGATETVIFNYATNHTMTQPEEFKQSQYELPGGYGLLTGATMDVSSMRA